MFEQTAAKNIAELDIRWQMLNVMKSEVAVIGGTTNVAERN